jgi:RNA polymerase sigma-70 factor (ECF subfamily)
LIAVTVLQQRDFMETMHDIWADLGARVRRYIGKRVSDSHIADDLTQDVMLKVQGHWDSRPTEERRKAWVFAIARNRVIDYYRARATRERSGTVDEIAAETSEDLQQETAGTLGPCLVRMMELLPAPYREGIKLADVEGLAQQVVAERTGMSLTGAKSRVQRARQQLREMVEDCCQVEQDRRGNVMEFMRTERSKRYCTEDNQNCDCVT